MVMGKGSCGAGCPKEKNGLGKVKVEVDWELGSVMG